MKAMLNHQLKEVERIAGLTKISRLLNNPYKYLFALAYRSFIYPFKQQEKLISVPLFFGKQMTIALPAATDIYLTGGKSHGSEIRLAKFMIAQLQSNQHFLDIGAHFGYFTLSAAELVGTNGKVNAFEPASKSFQILSENIRGLSHCSFEQKAVSNKDGMLSFYEFPTLHSEYNSTDIAQFEQEAWFAKTPPVKVEIPCSSIDQIVADGFSPHMIKIDAEGAEGNVIEGGQHFLQTQAPIIIMEYVELKRHNQEHQKAASILRQHGYSAYTISNLGTLELIVDIDAYLILHELESDNIVFQKPVNTK